MGPFLSNGSGGVSLGHIGDYWAYCESVLLGTYCWGVLSERIVGAYCRSVLLERIVGNVLSERIVGAYCWGVLLGRIVGAYGHTPQQYASEDLRVGTHGNRETNDGAANQRDSGIRDPQPAPIGVENPLHPGKSRQV